MTFVHFSSASILFLVLWSFRQDAARGATGTPSGQPRSSNPLMSSGLVEDLSQDSPVVGLLKVDYGNKATVVINGSLTPFETSRAPKSVALDGGTECAPPFALIMVDTDRSSGWGAMQRSWLHWMVINAKSTLELHKGEQVVQYEGPSPHPGTRPHRYLFLAYCQGGKTLNGAKLRPARRNDFDMHDFLRKLGSSVLLGTTFFYVDSAANTKNSPPT
ncbi:hypothetical protein HPB52_013474 [Rhipicephalus sanguineus]|uniref:Phosphatidylethanolamine-binding protein n=2 Tax=Rhipicephalus sanguineus TaxID=34632 RepID=A0A9D4PWA5_RHISA|nr:hypothetical protein HPB52_013474 [Rhipicephalus sanguineus]